MGREAALGWRAGSRSGAARFGGAVAGRLPSQCGKYFSFGNYSSSVYTGSPTVGAAGGNPLE